jgi:hypothetical protein
MATGTSPSVAYVGEIDLNLQQAYVKGGGIKGAFWANLLAAEHVAMAGGASTLRARLPDIRIDALEHGGLLLVATGSPLPEDTEETRRRFLELDAALRPAFLSKKSDAPVHAQLARILLPRTILSFDRQRSSSSTGSSRTIGVSAPPRRSSIAT